MTIPILFEDDVMVVINKPPGIIVNRAESVKVETIQDWIEQTYDFKTKFPHTPTPQVTGDDGVPVYDIVQEFLSRSGFVHRIDKETSGILLIAKNPEAFGLLKQQFMERDIQKTYVTLIHDKLPSIDGDINAPVGRLPWNKEHFGVVPEGKPAVTHYHVLETFERTVKHKKEIYQLVECYPKTGRTHQIRVHLKYLNRPILGDYLYAGRKTARDDRTWVPRVMLHAAKITFQHPITKQDMTIEAPMPEDMLQTIHHIKN